MNIICFIAGLWLGVGIMIALIMGEQDEIPLWKYACAIFLWPFWTALGFFMHAIGRWE